MEAVVIKILNVEFIPFPLRCLAELLAGQAKCDLKQARFEAANARANAALEVHTTCGEAFLVRGQVWWCTLNGGIRWQCCLRRDMHLYAVL